MPELHVGERHWSVPTGSNLLDALNQAGVAVPYSCRAGSCHACLVRCQGEVEDRQPDALNPTQRQEGWRLACQCHVSGDVRVETFDPTRDGLAAQVVGLDWLSPTVLRLRLQPERGLRYRAGQHVVLWAGNVARPYSLASLPQEDPFLEFHLDCRQPGEFSDLARRLRVGEQRAEGLRRGAQVGDGLEQRRDVERHRADAFDELAGARQRQPASARRLLVPVQRFQVVAHVLLVVRRRVAAELVRP